jgi:hypothetical protein
MGKRWCILLVFVLMWNLSFAQKVQLDSIRWITKSLGYLYFSQGHINYNFDGIDGSKSKYAIVKDTLIMTDIYTSSADKFSKKHRDDFKFLIRNITPSRLYLKAVAPNAVKLAGNVTYEFTNFKNSYDKDIKFSKLSFLSSTCYGDCPQLGIEILPNGNYQLKAGEHVGNYSGTYTGKLSAAQLDTLNYLLKHSELKKMTDWEQTGTVADAPNYYFAIEYTNTKKKLSITTNKPPMNITDLISFMLQSYKNVTLTKVQEQAN